MTRLELSQADDVFFMQGSQMATQQLVAASGCAQHSCLLE